MPLCFIKSISVGNMTCHDIYPHREKARLFGMGQQRHRLACASPQSDQCHCYSLSRKYSKQTWFIQNLIFVAQSQKVFFRGGPTLNYFFLFLLMSESKYHQNLAIISPPVKHHLNGLSLAD